MLWQANTSQIQKSLINARNTPFRARNHLTIRTASNFDLSLRLV